MIRGINKIGPRMSAVGSAGWIASKPEPHEQGVYNAISLDLADPFSSLYSGTSGGILFEDPFYALLACYNLGYLRKLSVLPQCTSWQEAWARRGKILESIEARAYNPHDWFVDCHPKSSGGIPRVELLSLEAQTLGRLRTSGLGEVYKVRMPGKYALYLLTPPRKA
jgi:hypothetical protein